MIDFDNLRKTIVTGLKEYLSIPVIRSSQTSAPPAYPYCSYTITNISDRNNGTWGEYDDGISRKPMVQTWSFTIQSDDNNEALNLTIKARDYFDLIGRDALAKQGFIVQTVGGVNNRDNLITIEYEYRHGFDVNFYMLNELKRDQEIVDDIELIYLNNGG